MPSPSSTPKWANVSAATTIKTPRTPTVFCCANIPPAATPLTPCLVCAKLQRDQLADYAGATQTYKDFLKRFPRSPRKREAQEGVAELALLENNAKPSPDKDPVNSDKVIAEATLPRDESSDVLPPSSTAPHSPGIPRLRRIRSAVTEDSTRVTIDLEDVVHYNSGRLENPERIFFDLREARLTSDVAREVARENANVDGDVLTAIRVGSKSRWCSAHRP